ncbi:hypothetical protein B6D60_11735 [candidate division KSB1 bacterium 4484_87]|nr:MAG: hypothetical protein B6D60_11735 [candidate division KSB1 bacterium 4484_87]
MKLLMFYVQSFHYNPVLKASDEFDDEAIEGVAENAVLGFIHVEAEDEEKISHSVTRLIKNLKWLAGKNGTKKIVLHSFSHLSDSKGSAATVKDIFAQATQRLTSSGYDVSQTPLGYMCDISLSAPGTPLARVFKSF